MRLQAILAISVALALAGVAAACGGDGYGGGSMMGDDGRGRVDSHFLAGMIPHHDSAVEMGEIARGRAEHREIKRLAEDIIKTQTAEIREMQSLQKEVGPASGGRPRGMPMMGDTQASELEGARPFDRAFIDEMVPHHQMAIQMATMVERRGSNERVRDLARRIVASQSREVRLMNEWRTDWYGAPARGAGMGHSG